MKLLSPAEAAFALHILGETPAAIFFFFRPSQTLRTPQPHAHGVIRQYALLLMATNVIAWAAYHRESDEFTKSIAGALVLHHVGPVIRAFARGTSGAPGRKVGWPLVHAVFHLICILLLSNSFLDLISW